MKMKKLSISERRSGKVIIVDLEGNIRLGDGSMEFRRLIRQLVQTSEKKILLNLARVTYIDSSGLGEIVAGFTSIQKIDGKLKLLHLTRRVSELMMMTKLLTVFESFANEAEAVRSFQTDSENAAPEQSSIVTGKLNPAVINL
jgi:anti-sigma B factor antagonist